MKEKLEYLAVALAAGILDRLECPKCHEDAVSVWFTRARPDQYRTWFICKDCSFHTRAQNAGRPEHFSEDRVDKKLEALDREVFDEMDRHK